MFRVGKNTQLLRLKTVPSSLPCSKASLQSCTSCTKAGRPPLSAKRCLSTTTTPQKNNALGRKIAGTIAVLTGGGLVGGAVLYSYNEDFRKFVNQSLPIIETFNLALGPALKSSVENNNNSTDEKSLLKPKFTEIKPFIDVKPKEKEKPGEPGGGKSEAKKNVASLSSLDQTTVSVVDLDIASVVENEVKQIQKESPAPPPKAGKKSTKESGPDKLQDSVASFVSVVDQPTMSAVDQTITKVVKPQPSPVIKEVDTTTEDVKLQTKEDSVPQDTSLTEKELSDMVDQTAMEIMVEEALSDLKKSAQDAVNAQKKATDSVLSHIKLLKNALEQEDAGSMKELSKVVLDAQKDADTAISEAKASQVKVNQEIAKLYGVIKEAEASGAKEAGLKASEEAAKITYEVTNKASDLQKAESEDTLLQEHQKYLEESKHMLKKEVEEVLPGVLKETKGKGKKVDEAKSDAVLLAYARKRIEHLKQDLASHREEEQKRLEQVLSVQRKEDAKLAEIKIKQELEKLRAEFHISQKKRESELDLEHETNLRQQLRRQAAAYSDHLTEVLRVQSQELQERHDQQLNKKLNEEKEEYSNKLKAALSRLRGIEAAVDGRADIEKSNKEAQDLFVACQSLQTAIDSRLKALKPLFPEVSAIQNAAPNDSAVSNLIAAVPEEAVERGIYNEKNLASRFADVLKSCRRVAMVNEDNKGPWTYFVSYIQSFFIIDKFDPRKDGELIDLENVDTFGLLARAEYYVRKGDLELAARLVNQLQGEPRKVAHDWLKEVRLLLETKQVARFLTSYAASLGMGGMEN